jgi:hypothetical protein
MTDKELVEILRIGQNATCAIVDKHRVYLSWWAGRIRDGHHRCRCGVEEF